MWKTGLFLRQQPGEEAVYSQLNKLLLPGGLRPFVESHREFSWTTHGQKGMLITWALGAEPAAASSLEQPAPSSASAAASAPAAPTADAFSGEEPAPSSASAVASASDASALLALQDVTGPVVLTSMD